MKNNINSNFDVLNILISPKTDFHSSKILTRTQSGKTLNKKQSLSTVFHNSFQNYFSKTPSSKFIIESEQLCQEKHQLMNKVKKLKNKLFLLKIQNKELVNQIEEKDEEINNILISNKNNSNKENSVLMIKINKQIQELKDKICLLEDKNFLLKKNNKLTKSNEYEIENLYFNEHIRQINNLIAYSYNIKTKNSEKIEEYDMLEQKIKDQKIILNELNEKINSLKKEENLKNKEIEDLNVILDKEKNKINLNNGIVLSLKKLNNTLTKESDSENKSFQNSKNLSLQEKIFEIKKSIFVYKNKIIEQEALINDLQKENNTLLQSNLNTTKNLNNEICNKINEIKNPINLKCDEEKEINNLKMDLQKSKQKEKELENQINIYQNKFKELIDSQSERTIQDIEFGIDIDNPFYSNDENNEIIKSRKINNVQFNQFTYILLKNFESKNIILNNSKSLLIDDLYDSNNSNSKNNKNNVIDENFNNIINRFTKKISELLNCENENSIIKLKIYLGALLYNNKGNINKFYEYLNVLFSYNLDYTIEKEEELKKEIVNNYLKSYENLINVLIKEKGNHEYISLLDMKNLIDNNVKDLNDKYIEYFFYIMKKFDDPLSELEDLKIANLINLIKINDDNNNKDNKNKNEDNIIKENDKSKEEEKNNNENQSEKNNEDESMTEITNEDYIKNINFALSKINEALEKNNYTNIKEYLKDKIQDITINEKNIKTISIEELNIQIKKINVYLNDIQLSCLCSKFSIPDNLRTINIEELENELINYSKNKTIEFDKDKITFDE